MQRVIAAAVALTLSGAVAPHGALASQELARSKGCVACHAMDKKLVGPAFKDVAARYADERGAEDRLVEKVLKGSQGAWGAIPMPANTNVSQEEARALVRWILQGG
ncbi:MAG TPA: c-type cytochrome [Noviherbaspirillum sp.]|nr:c-type cytochrome [Noviherbaspirillum sp.]